MFSDWPKTDWSRKLLGSWRKLTKFYCPKEDVEENLLFPYLACLWLGKASKRVWKYQPISCITTTWSTVNQIPCKTDILFIYACLTHLLGLFHSTEIIYVRFLLTWKWTHRSLNFFLLHLWLWPCGYHLPAKMVSAYMCIYIVLNKGASEYGYWSYTSIRIYGSRQVKS